MANEPQKIRLARDKSIPVRKIVPAKESNTMPTFRDNPYPMCNFLVDIEGDSNTVVAGFMECSGLESETEVIEYRKGNEN